MATAAPQGLTFVTLKRDPLGAEFNFRSQKEMRFSTPPSRLVEALLFFQPVMLICVLFPLPPLPCRTLAWAELLLLFSEMACSMAFRVLSRV
jgi:hypothetical protein